MLLSPLLRVYPQRRPLHLVSLIYVAFSALVLIEFHLSFLDHTLSRFRLHQIKVFWASSACVLEVKLMNQDEGLLPDYQKISLATQTAVLP